MANNNLYLFIEFNSGEYTIKLLNSVPCPIMFTTEEDEGTIPSVYNSQDFKHIHTRNISFISFIASKIYELLYKINNTQSKYFLLDTAYRIVLDWFIDGYKTAIWDITDIHNIKKIDAEYPCIYCGICEDLKDDESDNENNENNEIDEQLFTIRQQIDNLYNQVADLNDSKKIIKTILDNHAACLDDLETENEILKSMIFQLLNK